MSQREMVNNINKMVLCSCHSYMGIDREGVKGLRQKNIKFIKGFHEHYKLLHASIQRCYEHFKVLHAGI